MLQHNTFIEFLCFCRPCAAARHMRSVRKLHLWSSLPSHASASVSVELSAMFGVLDLRLRKAVTRLE